MPNEIHKKQVQQTAKGHKLTSQTIGLISARPKCGDIFGTGFNKGGVVGYRKLAKTMKTMFFRESLL